MQPSLVDIEPLLGETRSLSGDTQFVFRNIRTPDEEAQWAKLNLVLEKGLLDRAHRCISGSVDSWAPSMENGFQVPKFLFEVQKASSLFCLVQNGPVVIWVACVGLIWSSKWSLRSARAFSEAFWTFSPISLV